MPEMRVWPVSGLEVTRKVGSSWARRCRPMDRRSWSPFEFGSMDIEMTGSAKVVFSRIRSSSAVRVSPVAMSFGPMMAQMSPE